MASAPFTFEITSDLAASPRRVLDHAATMAGVNHELGPLLRMTAPKAFEEHTLFDAPTGQPLFRSWLLFAGIVPVDFDHLSFEHIDPASGFVESSRMLSMASWRHERRVTGGEAGGSRIVDSIALAPRIPGTGPLLVRVARALFHHRHARLRAMFGTPAAAPSSLARGA